MLGRIENYVLEKEGVAISGSRVCEEHFEVGLRYCSLMRHLVGIRVGGESTKSRDVQAQARETFKN
jgi:hypothetical protein